MSDLEKNWDDLPIGPAPIDAILHEAHRVDMRNEMRAELRAEAEATAAAELAARRRRRRVAGRPLVAAAAVTGVAATLAVGANLGGGGGGGGVGDVHPAAFQADLKPARSCDDLLSTYVDRGLKLVSAYGWGGPQIYEAMGSGGAMPRDGIYNDTGAKLLNQYRSAGSTAALRGTLDSLHGNAPYADTPETRAQASSKTGTNVQEAGVDEPDTVKTDGKILAQLHDDELWLYDVSGDAVKRLSSLPVDGVDNPEMLLSGHTIVVIGGSSDDTDVPFTRVVTLDVSDPRSPKQTDTVTYGGSLLSARQHDDAIRLVLSTGLPDLPFTEPHGSVSERDALAANKKVVRDSSIKDWLPTIAANGGDQRQLLNCTDVAVPDDKVGLDTVAIAGFTADDPTKVDAIGLAGATDLAYESTDHLYLVASPSSYGCGGPMMCPLEDGPGDIGRPYLAPSDGTSYLFDFALNGEDAIHVASGEVEGQIRDRWAMDEVDGVLRVAVGPTSQTGNFNSIVTLRKRGEELLEAGRIDGIGRGEEIKSARWFEGLAILTTYRQRDPMFAVDLTDAHHPRLLGELRLPGYSSYLHPLGKHRIIGVGTGPGGNTQVGLFDTTDLTHLKRLDEAHFRGTDPLAATDPRTFTWMQSQRTAYTVLQRWGVSRVGYLATLELRNAHFVTHLQQVEYGDDVDQVRTVPVSADKVVLTTGQDARFLPPLPRG